MTHPLTPREKVARAVYDTVTRFDGDTVGTHLGLSAMIDAAAPTVDDERRIVKSVCDDIADSILTALASGSGDHAELAKRLRASKRNRHGIYGRVLWSTLTAQPQPSALEALLAENAAMRAANTEAERKLAEAVELLKQALGDMDRRVITAETANRIDYFISKEAERG